MKSKPSGVSKEAVECEAILGKISFDKEIETIVKALKVFLELAANVIQ